MKEFFTGNRKKYLYILVVCFVTGMASHGYRLMNNLYTHDALMDIVEDNIQYQRSLGRFMQIFSILLRGSICEPWIIGCVGLFFISLAAFLIVDLLKIQGKVAMGLVAGIMVCNIVVTTSAASFIPWFDVYGEALFFATLGIWLICRDKLYGYALGSVSLIVSLGLYQAYIDVALFLALIYFMKAFRNEEKISKVWVRVLKAGASLICSAIGYYVLYKLVCILHKVTVGNSYNSLSQMSDYSGVSFGNLIVTAYGNFGKFLLGSEGFYAKIGAHTDIWTMITKVSAMMIIIAIVVGIVLIMVSKRVRPIVYIIQILGLLFAPLFANVVCVISKGVEHTLMTYAFLLVFVFAISVWEEYKELNSTRYTITANGVVLVLVGLLVWNNIVFSNQIYFKMDMQERAFESFATRMVSDIERTEGYQYGKTQVVFYGSFEESPYIKNIPYIGEGSVHGVGKTPITYMGTFSSFSTYVLNLNMNYALGSDADDMIKNMPSYPSNGSIVVADGVVIVKISD